MNKFVQALQWDRPIILDGGLATQLESMGFDIGGALWSAQLLDRNPRAIVDAHLAYLDAGAECIISASYQASRGGFTSIGKTEAEADELVASAVALAQVARAEFLENNPGSERQPLVAASVGPYGAIMQDGSEYTGDYKVSGRELCEFHTQRLSVLDGTGADLLAVETIPNIIEAQVLSELLADVDTPAWVSFCCRNECNISDGTSLATAAQLFAGHPKVLAVGINCTPPQYVSSLIPIVKFAAPDKAIVVYPNSGETYHADDNSWSGTACDFDDAFDIISWRKAGAKLIGGCCRTGPSDIAEMRTRLCQ